MGMNARQLGDALDSLARDDPALAAALAAHGHPAPRSRPAGAGTLVRAILAQQLAVKAAQTITGRVEALVGDLDDMAALMALPDDALRGAGLSRQKLGYVRALAEAVLSGTLDMAALPDLADEAAIAMLTQVRGLGRWTAEIYLLFAEGRPDIWPAADLALQEGTRQLLQLDARPNERALREIGARWTPHRGAMAVFLWHYYGAERDRAAASAAQAGSAPMG